MFLLRYFDLLLVALALPIFLVVGLPILGWGVGAGAWLLQRGVQVYLERRAKGSKDPRTVVGLLAGSMIGRGWLVALAVLLVGLSDRHAGLAAAVLVIVLFTVYFTMKMVLRPFDEAPKSGSAGAPEAVSGGIHRVPDAPKAVSGDIHRVSDAPEAVSGRVARAGGGR